MLAKSSALTRNVMLNFVRHGSHGGIPGGVIIDFLLGHKFFNSTHEKKLHNFSFFHRDFRMFPSAFTADIV
jgi:hypothetical protein